MYTLEKGQCTSNKPNVFNLIKTLNFNEEEIIKIIGNLTIHKAHGHDDISIRYLYPYLVKILKK